MTTENDVVLVYAKDDPLFFARVERITADVKPGWFKVTLLVLTLPLTTVEWILKEAYINGAEFTMGGVPMRIEKVQSPVEKDKKIKDENQKPKEKPSVVISFEDRKKV